VEKGSLIHILKRKNNIVVGLDISQTAVDIASERFPDIKFICSDVNTTSNYTKIVDNMGGKSCIY
jgi:trans-aconitate methyltransferase